MEGEKKFSAVLESLPALHPNQDQTNGVMKKVAGREASLIWSRQPGPPLKAADGTNSITEATRASPTSSGQNKYVPSAAILIDHKLNSMAAPECNFQSMLSGTLTEPTSASGGG